MRTEPRILGRAASRAANTLSERPRRFAGVIMDSSFDPLYTWLGIPPHDQPPDHYRLLGVQRFEENREVISHAADQRVAHVRSFQTGPHSRETQQVLNELSKASGCLLNPRRKAMYDQHLRSTEVTAKSEEARLPPQPAAAPAVQIRVGGASPAKSPARSPGGRPARKSWLLALVATVFGLATLAIAATWFLWSRSSETTFGASPETPPSPVATQDRAPVPSEGEKKISPAKTTGEPTEQPVPPTQTSVAETRSRPETTSVPASSTAVSPATASSPAVAERPATLPLTSTPTDTRTSNPAAAEQPEKTDNVAMLAKGTPKALHFSGSDRVEVLNSSGLIDPRKEWTVELWVRLAPDRTAHWLVGDLVIGPNHPDVPAGLVNGWQFFIQQTVADRHRVAFSTKDGYASDFPVMANTWRHLAVANDTREVVIYADGRRAAAGDVSRLLASFAPSPIPMFLGSHGYLHANQAPGLVGDLRAFRVSSVCRYRSAFEPPASFALDESCAVAWDMTQSTGDRVVDLSPHGRHGRIAGATWIPLPEPTATAVASAPSTATPGTPVTSSTPPSMAATTASVPSLPKLEEIRPIPDEVALAKARMQVRQVFEAELKQAKEAKQLLALSEKLLGLAAESHEDHAGRYAMFEEAQRLAAQAGDLAKSLSVIDDWSRRFEIRTAEIKTVAVTKCAEVLKTTADRRRLAETALSLCEECRVAGQFEEAASLAQLAITTATRLKDAELGKSARDVRDEINYAKKRVAAALETKKKLATNPEDLAANAEWGRFACLCQRNWSLGLPHLARGSAGPLATAAKLDLAGPTQPEEQVAAGQAWLAGVKGVEAGERDSVHLRALHWFRLAETQAKGLARANVEQQIKELEADLAPRHRQAAKTSRPHGAPFQPPAEFVGLPGRLHVNGSDVGVLWKYEGGLRLTQANVVGILTQANVPRGKLRLEFVGLLQLSESATVTFNHAGGSTTGTATLIVDNKPVGEVGGKQSTTTTHRVELNAGEHTVRWILSGDDLGSNVLACAHAANGQAIVLYHNPAILNLVRTTPSPARLNVNMARN